MVAGPNPPDSQAILPVEAYILQSFHYKLIGTLAVQICNAFEVRAFRLFSNVMYRSDQIIASRTSDLHCEDCSWFSITSPAEKIREEYISDVLLICQVPDQLRSIMPPKQPFSAERAQEFAKLAIVKATESSGKDGLPAAAVRSRAPRDNDRTSKPCMQDGGG